MDGNCILNVSKIPSHIRWIILIINVTTCLPIVLGNLIVISVISLHKELRTRPNFLVCCLAVTDLAVGIILQPLLSVHLQNGPSDADCFMADAVYYMISLFCSASCLTLVLISYDRYLHLTKLLHYHDFMPKRKLLILVKACWVIPIIEGFLLFSRSTHSLFFAFAVIRTFCDLIICLVCYRKIFTFIREMSKIFPSRSTAGENESSDRVQFNKHSRLAKNFAILVACFIICWIPVKVILVYFLFVSIAHTRLDKLDPYIDTIHLFAILIGIFNSLMNPLIYFWKNITLRQKAEAALKKIFCET